MNLKNEQKKNENHFGKKSAGWSYVNTCGPMITVLV